MSYLASRAAKQCTCRAHSASFHFQLARKLKLEDSFALPPGMYLDLFQPDLTTSVAWYDSKKDHPDICRFFDKVCNRISFDMSFSELEALWVTIMVEEKKIKSPSQKKKDDARQHEFITIKTLMNIDLEFYIRPPHEVRYAVWQQNVANNVIPTEVEEIADSLDEPIASLDEEEPIPSIKANNNDAIVKIMRYEHRLKYLSHIPQRTFTIYAPPYSGKSTLKSDPQYERFCSDTDDLPFRRHPLILFTNHWEILRYEMNYVAFLPSRSEFKERFIKRSIKYQDAYYDHVLNKLDMRRTIHTNDYISKFFSNKIFVMILSGASALDVIVELGK